MGRTLYDKIWESHAVHAYDAATTVLYVDRHLIFEVSSPQAFASLGAAGRPVRRPDLTFATMDHSVSTRSRDWGAAGESSRVQLQTLARNCREAGIVIYDIQHPDQGIIHVIAPELGLIQPGMLVVCGDSHTSTHGAYGALAFGIGTSEVEHVLATQTLLQKKARNMLIRLEGTMPRGVTPKDLILAIIGRIGIGGASGHVIEYAGSAIAALDMASRMTICNMSVECGAKAGMIAPDDITFANLRTRDFAPKGRQWEHALEHWKQLRSDPDARYDSEHAISIGSLAPQVTWGINPSQTVGVDCSVPAPENIRNPIERELAIKALAYMDLKPGTPMTSVKIDTVFLGSCTNGRIEDLRGAARIISGRKVAAGVNGIVVPGSSRVKRQAESEGLDEVFKTAGFEWRESGCSLCLAMNDDVLEPGRRCASTSNRNFEGRQGKGGRTHLVSPAMAAAAAIAGHFVDVRAL